MTRILTRADLEAVATTRMALEAVEHAFRSMAEGTAAMPAKVYLDLPEHAGDFRAMPAKLGEVAGLKWVNSHPENPKRHGLPSVLGLYVLSDPATALPLAVMDGTSLTALRTGAAAGVASKHLARSDAKTLGLVGAGVQALQFLNAHRELFPGIEVRVADKDGERASRFAAEHGVVLASTEEAADSDIVCIATPSRSPVITARMVKAGAHINAMGADAPGKQELDGALLVSARVFVDDMEQATHSGEVNVPLHRGEFAREQIAGVIGDVIIGRTTGRRDSDQITVFDSTGLAVQDLALAARIYESAGDRGIEADIVGVS